jgi:hypothetical protein
VLKELDLPVKKGEYASIENRRSHRKLQSIFLPTIIIILVKVPVDVPPLGDIKKPLLVCALDTV